MERALAGNFVLIAEIGVNHFDIAKKELITPMQAAKLMIREAKNVGIHAVKFQSYKAGTLASKNSPSYWDTNEEPTTSQYELFSKFDSFGYLEYAELSRYCEELNIEFLSTPFDFESADYLDELMNVYKISSSDLTNHPLVEFISKKNKPIILSVGASNEDEIKQTIGIIRKHNRQQLILMHCILEYPTPYDHANLSRILTLKKEFSDVIVGYSDHTKPDSNYDVLKTAYNLGALVIEKHFTLDKKLRGNDHYHAMDSEDAGKIIEGIEFLNSIKGSFVINVLDSEYISRLNARRSIVSKVKIKAGQVIDENMLSFKRPGTGISPSRINEIIGKTAKMDILEDVILNFEMLY
jgi:N-acetylneuraminate synthase